MLRTRQRHTRPAYTLRRWTYLLPADMWQQWRVFFPCDDSAIAVLVWLSNKSVKGAPEEARHLFYSCKDAFIRRYGTQGQVGWLEDRRHGAYSVCVYTHEFWVAGSYYRMHSTVKPKVLLDDGAAPTSETGVLLDGNLLAQLTLPLSGYLKLLGYVATARWHMQRAGEVFVERDGS